MPKTSESVVARESQHTQLPWHLHSSWPDQVHAMPRETYSEGDLIATAAGEYTSAETQANAEFIVRACNAHEKLVEALQAALALINEYADELAGFEHPDRINAVCDISAAALVKANAGVE